MPDSDPAPAPAPLPPRAPRGLAVHWAVDTAVAFLAVVVLALFFRTPLWTVIVGAAVAGLALAPLTRRVEIRALAARTGRPEA